MLIDKPFGKYELDILWPDKFTDSVDLYTNLWWLEWLGEWFVLLDQFERVDELKNTLEDDIDDFDYIDNLEIENYLRSFMEWLK